MHYLIIYYFSLLNLKPMITLDKIVYHLPFHSTLCLIFIYVLQMVRVYSFSSGSTLERLDNVHSAIMNSVTMNILYLSSGTCKSFPRAWRGAVGWQSVHLNFTRSWHVPSPIRSISEVYESFCWSKSFPASGAIRLLHVANLAVINLTAAWVWMTRTTHATQHLLLRTQVTCVCLPGISSARLLPISILCCYIWRN